MAPSLRSATNGFITHGWYDPELYNLTGQQPQCLVDVTFGRWSETRCDDLDFLISIEKLFGWWMRTLGSVERLFKTTLDKTLSHVLNRLDTARKRLGYLLVRPVRPVSVRLEQDLGPTYFLAGPLKLLGHHAQFVSLLTRKADDVSFLHGNLLVPDSVVNSAKPANPKIKL